LPRADFDTDIRLEDLIPVTWLAIFRIYFKYIAIENNRHGVEDRHKNVSLKEKAPAMKRISRF